jgi:hypothetical protein
MMAAKVLSPAWAENMTGDGVYLQGLDKVTARISVIHATNGTPVRFGTLEITSHKCFKRPPEETPESAALVEIREVRSPTQRPILFRGWMFASSPALNALEHPVYDVWIKDCLNAKSPDVKSPDVKSPK